MIANPVYLDCDTGIDDALALGYLLTGPTDLVDLVGVGTVHGNVSAAGGAENTRRLLALAGRDVPVATGASDPLVG
ncbi:MAG: nucleoside hydrolase, partial [Corynebacterium sp.]|nr:nucleoside hydrolase [Corynebacterium sp.]